jgi:hypothetical protein
VNVLRERLRQSWKIGGLEAWLIDLLEETNLDVLQLVVDSVSDLGPLKRSSEAVGDGNRKVFEAFENYRAASLAQDPKERAELRPACISSERAVSGD